MNASRPNPSLVEVIGWTIFFGGAAGAAAWNPYALTAVWFLGYATAVSYLRNKYDLKILYVYYINSWPITIWPVIAILSSAWSLVPFLTFYQSLQFLVTVCIGLILAMRFSLHQIISILFLSQLFTVLTSIILVVLGLNIYNGNVVVYGLFPHKNIMGMCAAGLAISSLILMGSGRKKYLYIFGLMLSSYAILSSNSGTSIICYIVLTSVILAFALYQTQSRSFFIMICLLVIFVLLVGMYYQIITGRSTIDEILGLLGKDRTLTGRSILWMYGWRAFEENPWIGIGFRAYFNSPDTNSFLAQYTLSQAVPYLHNNYLEVLVAVGVFGFAFFLLGILWVAKKAWDSARYGQDFCSIWPFATVVQCLIYSLAENPLFYNHSLLQVLFVVSAACCQVDIKLKCTQEIIGRHLTFSPNAE